MGDTARFHGDAGERARGGTPAPRRLRVGARSRLRTPTRAAPRQGVETVNDSTVTDPPSAVVA